MKKKLFRLILSATLLAGVVTSAMVYNLTVEATTVKTFKDVPKTYWAYSSIIEGVNKGYLAGFPNGTFKPNDPVTVAQFLKMMFLSQTEKNAAGDITWPAEKMKLVPDWHKKYFEDTSISFESGSKGETWYANFVHTAQVLDLIREEYTDKYNDNLTRERAALILESFDEYFDGTLDDLYAEKSGPIFFKDYNKMDKGYQIAASKMAIRGIMVGNAQGYFNPKSAISRAEAAKITSVLSNEKARNPQKINMSSIPYAIVEAPGYGPRINIFANWEMKKTYDSLKTDQKNFPGSYQNDYGELRYYKNAENALKHFNQIYYFIDNVQDNNIYFDIVLSFSSNVYSINLSSDNDSLSRSSDVLDKFLKCILKNPSAVKEQINNTLKLEQKGGLSEYDKIVEGRQVVIYGTNRGFVSIGISAYADKK